MCKEEGDLLCRRPLDRLCYRGQGKLVSNRRSLRWGPRNAAILHKVTVFCTQLLLCKDCANVYKAGGNSKAASVFTALLWRFLHTQENCPKATVHRKDNIGCNKHHRENMQALSLLLFMFLPFIPSCPFSLSVNLNYRVFSDWQQGCQPVSVRCMVEAVSTRPCYSSERISISVCCHPVDRR